jgi:hypothetical protein
MPEAPSIPKIAWLLPIVLALCALMVLPGGTFLASVGQAGPSAGAAPVHAGSLSDLATLSANPNGPVASPAASLLSGVPARLSSVPWIASLTHQGPSLAPLTSLPNLALLEHPVPVSNGTVDPFYTAQPAPLGVGDYGLGATPYSYNVSDIQGQLTLNAPPNVTDPASSGLIEPGGQADGYVGSYHEFGVQLNTVATNMSIPGSDEGFFWTQNVVNWNDTGIHFVSDTFNLTSATQNPFFIAPGTIYSACDLTTQAAIDKVLFNYGGVFQCVGGTVPITPASYPITIQLFNNASVNAQDRTQVVYGYRITEAGTGTVVTGVADRVVFNSPGAPGSAPANKPGFSIDGFAGAPSGLFRDAEIVIVGDIGGDNSVFRSINGSLSLWYTNSTHQAWQTTPSAYNFGGDTGETSTGIADYWTPSHTVSLNQGPSMLYGLWNADPWASVASGDIHVAGSITPNYGFVFVSNTHPVIDPLNGVARDNMSWLPTTNTGTFSTYLPPLGAPWTTQYWVEGFAAGFAEKHGPAITGQTTSYALNLKAAPSAPLNAPLYAFSNAQAVNLAKHVTGSSAVPLMFSNLVVNMNFTFEHVNDYAYATFEVFNLQNVSSAFDVNNTYQGMDAPTENFVIYDFPASGSTGVLSTPPAVIGPRAYATSAINIFEDNHVLVTNQTTAGDGYNLQVELWNDWYASVSQIVSVYGSSGVFVGDSSQTLVTDVSASLGSDAVTDIGSTGTVGAELSANGAGSAVASALSDAGAGFYSIAATNGASGVVSGEDYGAGAAYDSYYYLAGTNGLLVDGAYAINGSVAVNASLSTNVLVTDVWAWEDSYGVRTDGSHGVYVWHVSARDGSIGVYLWHSTRVYVADVFALGNSVGVWVGNSNSVQVEWVHAGYHSVGVIVVNSTHVRISHVTAKHSSIAIEVL